MIEPSKRKNIVHLQKMKDLDFLDICGKTIVVTPSVKIDGVAIRFGKDIDGNFFFETARSGPITKRGQFLNHAKQNNLDLTRALCYESLSEIVRSAPGIDLLPNDTKILCEALYHRFESRSEDGISTFVSLGYPTELITHPVIIFPYAAVQASTGKPLSYRFFDTQNGLMKVINPRLPTCSMEIPSVDIDRDALTSLKHKDREKKAEEKAKLADHKQKVADLIYSKYLTSAQSVFGPNIEGIVFMVNNTVVKIVSPEYKKVRHVG